MQMLNLKNLRDVVPFPKVQNASELMSNCPAEVSPEQLAELGIAIVQKEEKDG
jgi:aspartyl-tRNA synthetase